MHAEAHGVRKLTVSIFLYAFSLILASTPAVAAQSLESVSLQLEWKYQFEFAGFIMAKEKGFYEKAGLDVELIEYEAGIDAVEHVLTGKSNYAIHNSSVVIDNGKLEPIILLATYFQQSPLVFVTSKEIKSPSDLIGKTIMGTKDELKYSSLALLLDHFYVNKNNASFLGHSFNIDDFIQHKVDAMTAFRTNQLYQLDQLNVPYNVIDPADYGFVMSAVNLFTSYSEALNHSERTRKFIDASNKGWEYALAHTEETIAIIYEKYSKLKSIEALAYEADITREMMLLDFFEIGATNKELALRAVKQFKHSGLLSAQQEPGTFLFDEVLREFGRSAIFTDKQKLYLQDKKVINMCVDPDWMPFESIQDGVHIGIVAEVFDLFRAQLPIPIKLIPTKSWHDSITKAKQRKCDIFSLASSTPERTEYMDFTTPYIDLPIVMATTMDKFFINDIAEVLDEKLGVVKGYAVAEKLRGKYENINIVEVDSITDGLERVASGELFGHIDNLMTIAASIQKDFTGILKVSSRLDEGVQLAVGTRNDEPILRGIFQKLVGNIDSDTQQGIFNKWVSVKQEVVADYTFLWKFFAGFSLLALGFIYHFRRLSRLNDQLVIISNTDKLSGLYNRVKMDSVLIEQKANVDRYGQGVSLILIDIDFFKEINDTYGHSVGDAVLVGFSELMRSNVRATDYVGRWGGEEFLIVCPNTGVNDAYKLADKLLKKVRDCTFEGGSKITISAGIAGFSKETSIKDILIHVDTALYQSKQAGRNQISTYK
ncbi:diguanylate cyclase (GGDEF) domain-containing protein [Mariprofundus aestuarium]|uniref:diguanylate cyclase n=1 Tax=Mariprofundus aestuarium TaxID=1921086 RepID=A0A2K8L0K3_MARES|nr:diguanylate cyclase [Mariprofundus aestuarium]ATX79341.1 diguanylate cyclase (GGDEF) domain-containing protein [Mariprofundus aestuarium]